jgi:hypothetical protein
MWLHGGQSKPNIAGAQPMKQDRRYVDSMMGGRFFTREAPEAKVRLVKDARDSIVVWLCGSALLIRNASRRKARERNREHLERDSTCG